jgi:DNA-binding transcriptional ArsR family regulator
MPSSKTHQYENSLIINAKIGRALAHPARLKILEVLNSRLYTRNTDLIQFLDLTQPTISSHIKKLDEAELIDLTFLSNSSTQISMKIGASERVKDFFCEYFEKY